MKKLFVLLNHPLLPVQLKESQEKFGITHTVTLSNDIWLGINPYVESIAKELEPIINRLLEEGSSGDYLLVQGDFGATYAMVSVAKKNGIIPIYATTARKATEVIENGKVITRREFNHAQFRKYEEIL